MYFYISILFPAYPECRAGFLAERLFWAQKLFWAVLKKLLIIILVLMIKSFLQTAVAHARPFWIALCASLRCSSLCTWKMQSRRGLPVLSNHLLLRGWLSFICSAEVWPETTVLCFGIAWGQELLSLAQGALQVLGHLLPAFGFVW